MAPSTSLATRWHSPPAVIERACDAAASASVTRPYVSIVVPVWNGGQRLCRTLHAIQGLLDRHAIATELIVVDDHSDGTTQEVIERFEDHAPIRVLRNDRNCGKGYSVTRGMLAARGAFRLFTDADLPYPPEEIEAVLDALEQGSDVAVACRVLPESRYMVNPAVLTHLFTRHVTSRCFNALTRTLLLRGILDTQAGLKGFTRAAAELIFPRVTIPRFGFDLECLYIAQQFQLNVAQVPVTFHLDHSASTVGVVRDSVRMVGDLGKVRLNAWRGRYA